MGYETRDPRETKETLQPEAGEQRRLSPTGQRAMQGRDVYVPRPDDVNFTDGQGRPIAIRTFSGSDQTYIRAYDRNVQTPPERPDPGQAGYANLKLEPDQTGNTRARLQDIYTAPAYRDNGVGSTMLNQAEKVAGQGGASEIYGSLSYEARNEAAVRKFYHNHGYSTRTSAQGGEEVYKKI
jgi:GNAT superfamily N-acetyltransferase